MTIYFWWENIKGIPESSEKALRIMYVTTVMVVLMIGWCVYTLLVRGGHLPPLPRLSQPCAIRTTRSAGCGTPACRTPSGSIGILIGLGHSVLAMSGEESLAQVYREIEHPKLPNLKKAGLVIFLYSLVFTAGVSFFAVMIIPDAVRPQFFDNLIGGLAMYLVGPVHAAAGFPGVCGDGRRSDARRRGEHRHRRIQRRAEPRFRRRHSARLVPASASPLRHFLPHAEPGRGPADLTIVLSRGDIFMLGEAYAFGVMWSFAMKGVGGAGAALQAAAASANSRCR